jgi:hypothetical protein
LYCRQIKQSFATISSEKEINTYNNTKNFAVEVMEKDKYSYHILINHPDIGALKRAIVNNRI